MTSRKTFEAPYFKALDEEKGTFEAVVSVFGNVDYQGDRVLPGAFSKSLEKWRKMGDPIPVIWSHDWADPFAHIGWVSPADAYEVVAEDAKAFAEGIVGGLYVKGQLDIDKPFAKQVYDLLKSRRVKEWSFAYDVIADQPSKDIPGATDLQVLDVHEVGPTLKGANGATTTLGVKQLEGVKTQLETAAGVERGLKKITAALDVDQEVGLKMLKDWVAEDVKAADSAAALTEAGVADMEEHTKEQHNGGIDGLRQHLVEKHGFARDEVDEKDETELNRMHDGKHEGDDEEKSAQLLEAYGIDAEKAQLKPWHIEERDGQFCVILDSDGSVEKCHPTRSEAMAHMRALYAAEAADETMPMMDAGKTFTMSPVSNGTATVTITPVVTTTSTGANGSKAGRSLSKETETKLRGVIDTLQGIVDSAAGSETADAADEGKAIDDAAVTAVDDAALKELEEYKRKLGLLDT